VKKNLKMKETVFEWFAPLGRTDSARNNNAGDTDASALLVRMQTALPYDRTRSPTAHRFSNRYDHRLAPKVLG